MAKKKWIQEAVKKMKAKGTLGSFGKATEEKISAARAKGGKMAKKAQFAANMKKIARKKAAKNLARKKARAAYA